MALPVSSGWIPKYRFNILKCEIAPEVERRIRSFTTHQKGEVVELNVQLYTSEINMSF